MKKKERRHYTFAVQRSYSYETHDKDGNVTSSITESEWREKVVNEIHDIFFNEELRSIFYIFHDSDIIEGEGLPKGLHVHMVAYFKDNHTHTAAVKIFLASSLKNCEPCKSYHDACRYLIHVSESALNEQKTLYDALEVHGWKYDEDGMEVPITLEDFKKAMVNRGTRKDKKDQKKVKDFYATQIMHGYMMPLDVSEIYESDNENVGFGASDFLVDYPMYERALAFWLMSVKRFYEKNPCSRTLIYIEGSSGTGKTQLCDALASEFADCHGIHNVSAKGAGKTFDFAGNYQGERVSLFGEASAAFSAKEFCNIFEPGRCVFVNSRNNDKPYFANYVIFASAVTLEDFIYSMWIKYAEENSQLSQDVRKALKKSSCSEKDWYEAYKKCPNLISDDMFWQIRRRIPIKVSLIDGYAHISYLCYDCYTDDSFLFSSGKYPYKISSAVPYNVSNKNRKTVEKQIKNLVKAIIEAIDSYYKYNGFTHPDEYRQPFSER
ncbi:MAG: hypothetical protein K2J37_03240 [Ruminococcus sp.]|nr:hypothetical protein [Ruminococcus sp.]